MAEIYIYVSAGILIVNIIYLIIRTILTYKSKITQVFLVNNKSLEQKMDLTDTMFDIFEQNSVDKVRVLLDEKCLEKNVSYVDSFELLTKYNELDKKLQLVQYQYVWVENKQELKTLCRKMIKRNGFHLKTGADLEHYMYSAFNTIFTESKNNINHHMDSFDGLKDTTAEQRFNVSEAKLLFRELIFNCIDIEKNNIKEIKRINKSFNVTTKIVGLIAKIFTRG